MGRDSLGRLFTTVTILRARHVGKSVMTDLGLPVRSETCVLVCTLPSGDSEVTKGRR